MAGEKKAPDWERIELDYRAGLKTLRQIAGEHGVSHVAINNRAKRGGWDRDLAAKIRAKADALVTKADVTADVTSARAVTERQVVDANAAAIAGVRLAHRQDIRRARSVVNALFAELDAQTADDATPTIDLANRARIAQTLTTSLKAAVDMEREAFSIGAEKSSTNPLDDLIARWSSTGSNALTPVAVDPEHA